jgi:hypothetical protein
MQKSKYVNEPTKQINFMEIHKIFCYGLLLLGGFRLGGCLPTDELDAGFWETAEQAPDPGIFRTKKEGLPSSMRNLQVCTKSIQQFIIYVTCLYFLSFLRRYFILQISYLGCIFNGLRPATFKALSLLNTQNTILYERTRSLCSLTCSCSRMDLFM